jgi:SAM-dependent methyltransferase
LTDTVRYALLVSPSSNRVYAQAAAALAVAELGVVSEQVLGGALGEIREQTLGSVAYVTFEAEELGDVALGWLSNLAATFALFRLDDGRLLPLELRRWDQLDSDLVSIQKYSGKTNEAFTKLLLNVTLAASAFAQEPLGLSVLDPLCGRGTTLNQALTYGFNATGVEHDAKDFEAYSLFIQRWVKDKRFKHEAVRGSVKGHPKLDLQLGLDKARYKAGETLRVCFVNADTSSCARVFQPRSFDLIVTDAPYGVQHGSQAASGMSRRPLELLTEAIPIWTPLLRPGGAIGIAWNTLVARREQLAALLTQNGLNVCDSAAYRGFQHRVDSSIERDLIVASLAPLTP